MNRSEIKSRAGFYVSQVVILSMLIWFAFNIWGGESVQLPSSIGCIFTMSFYTIDGWLWYWVVSRHKDYLTSFFTGTSGFRFLMALAVLGIYYWATKGADMITFLWVFMVYYMVLLIHHSIYFSRMSKRV